MSRSGNMLSASLLTLERFIFYSFLSCCCCCCFSSCSKQWSSVFSHICIERIQPFFYCSPLFTGLVASPIRLGIHSFTYMKKKKSILKFDQIQNKRINQKILNDSHSTSKKSHNVILQNLKPN